MYTNPPESPVPSDARLWEGEAPFTEFGQWEEGKLDLRVFDQDTWWVDRLGRPHLIENMPKDYIDNVIAFLIENEKYFYQGTVMRALLQTTTDILEGLSILPGLDPNVLLKMTPHDWLQSTPLYLRLTLIAN